MDTEKDRLDSDISIESVHTMNTKAKINLYNRIITLKIQRELLQGKRKILLVEWLKAIANRNYKLIRYLIFFKVLSIVLLWSEQTQIYETFMAYN